jgi:uncharacterized membrane protein YeaQ/YmgE (transglycosylase-associated protein family)
MSTALPADIRFGNALEGNTPSVSEPLEKGREMGIIAFIILGLLAGIVAKAIMPGEDPGGIIVTAIIGIVGALLGGFIAAAVFGAHPLDEFFDISTWLTAILGAMLLLYVYRLVTRNRSGHRTA